MATSARGVGDPSRPAGDLGGPGTSSRQGRGRPAPFSLLSSSPGTSGRLAASALSCSRTSIECPHLLHFTGICAASIAGYLWTSVQTSQRTSAQRVCEPSRWSRTGIATASTWSDDRTVALPANRRQVGALAYRYWPGQRRATARESRALYCTRLSADCLTPLSDTAYCLGMSQRLMCSLDVRRQLASPQEHDMFIVFWVVIGVVLGGCAGLLLIAGLQLPRATGISDALSHVPGNGIHQAHPARADAAVSSTRGNR